MLGSSTLLSFVSLAPLLAVANAHALDSLSPSITKKRNTCSLQNFGPFPVTNSTFPSPFFNITTTTLPKTSKFKHKRTNPAPPQSPTPNTLTDLILKGQNHYLTLQFALRDPDHIDKPILSLCQSPTNPWAAGYYDHATPQLPDRELRRAMPASTFTSSQGEEVWSQPTFYRMGAHVPKSLPNYEGAEFHYVLEMSPERGIIGAADSRGVNGWGKRAPDRWSDVAFSLWTEVCTDISKQRAPLRYIVREHITSKETVGLIDTILATLPPSSTTPTARDQSTRILTPLLSSIPISPALSPTNKFFYAILASPNGVGIAHMLTDHAVALGRRDIKRIGVYKGVGWEKVLEQRGVGGSASGSASVKGETEGEGGKDWGEASPYWLWAELGSV